jgi:hypothetical protein
MPVPLSGVSRPGDSFPEVFDERGSSEGLIYFRG